MLLFLTSSAQVPDQGLVDEYCWVGLQDQPRSRYIVETLQNGIFLLVLMWCTLRLQSKSQTGVSVDVDAQ
jgi:hypothetical protein